MALRDLTFVVVDTETTGTDPSEDRVIEIGAVRVAGGEIVDRFEQLINPGVPVPRMITRLTGISQSMVEHAPSMPAVMSAFQRFAGDAPLVAHNAGFDHRFLALEALRSDLSSFENPFLCTLRLARRLLPGLPSKGLDALRTFYGLSIERRHRALDDADLTARILVRLFPHAEAAGARDLEGLFKLQAAQYAASGAVSRRLEHLRTERINHAPACPGVYRFTDRTGKLLYVGKARNLKNRLRQYVVAVEAHPPRTRRLMARVHDVEWQAMETEIEAMLVESVTIKEEQPPHNRAQRSYRRRPFIRIEQDDLAVRPVIRRDGASYFGPIRSAVLAQSLAEILASCFELKHTSRPQVRTPLHRERLEHALRASGWVRQNAGSAGHWAAFLEGQTEAVTECLNTAMRAASTEFDFEAAATIRDWREAISALAERPGELVPRVFDRDAILVADTEEGPPEVVALRDGLPVAFACGLERLESLVEQALGWVSPERLTMVNAEEAHVVAHWSHLHRDHLRAVERQPDESRQAFAERARREFGADVVVGAT